MKKVFINTNLLNVVLYNQKEYEKTKKNIKNNPKIFIDWFSVYTNKYSIKEYKSIQTPCA